MTNGGLVEVGGKFKIWTLGTVTLNGGTLDLDGPLEDGGGALAFTSGVMNVNDSSQQLIVSSSDVTVGGLSLGTSLNLGSNHTLNLSGNAIVDFAAQLTMSGGTLTSASLLVQPGASVNNSSGTSIIASRVLALAGSTINVTGGDLTIGDAATVNGFYGNGTVNVGGNTLTIEDSNDAVFDSGALLTLGAGGTPGTVNLANGMTLDFGGNITGHGTINTPNSAATPLINNGNITGDDPNAPITLIGYVKGVGTMDNVLITGTDAPGFSPAEVIRGSVSYDGTLEIELGGLDPGSEHDQLNHIQGAGIADLGGILDVSLLGGFTPSLGDTFDIITASGGVIGTFDSTLLPDLGSLLAMDVLYGSNNVALAVVPALDGDFDLNGQVDGLDFLLWQRDTSIGSLADWENNYGSVAPLAAATGTVPEPSTAVLLLMLSGTLLMGRHKLAR